jgi:hypothetical protein
MKQVFFMLSLVISTINVNAQSQTGNTSFNKSPQSSVIYNLPFSEEAVTDGVENKMISFGKPKKVKGFLMYQDVRIPEISTNALTIYFGADKKSNKDNNNAVLTMLLANEANRFFTIEENKELFSKAAVYLNGFEAAIAAASLELQINEQDEAVKKSDKKLKNFRDDRIDFENQKKKLDSKIEQNITDISNQEQEVIKQKELLDTLIKSRKN